MPPPHPSQSPQPDMPSCGCFLVVPRDRGTYRGTHTSTTPEPCRDVILTQGAARVTYQRLQPGSHRLKITAEQQKQLSRARFFSSPLWSCISSCCWDGGTHSTPGHTDLAYYGQCCLCMPQGYQVLQGSCEMSQSWSQRWQSG